MVGAHCSSLVTLSKTSSQLIILCVYVCSRLQIPFYFKHTHTHINKFEANTKITRHKVLKVSESNEKSLHINQPPLLNLMLHVYFAG